MISISSITLPGAPLGPENPLPYFRDCAHNRAFRDVGLLPEEKAGFGYETGARILPWTRQDGYTRVRSPMTFQTIVLENKYLRATFLPEYGGRLYSLYDKRLCRDLLCVNPVFQPANIAVRNAWFSGGVEWNLGQFGHSEYTCAPVYFARCKNEQGYEFLRMYEYERIKGFYLAIDFHLPPGEQQLFFHVSIYNSHNSPTSLYWWTNIAIEQEKEVRVFSGTSEVVYQEPSPDGRHGFRHAKMPFLPALPEVDVSFPDRIPLSNEYFFQNRPIPEELWESSVNRQGEFFFERSTMPLRYRKKFSWSAAPGGQHWQAFLTAPGGARYIELQAGLFPTQIHGGDAGPKESVHFTQAFGGASVPTDCYYGDWETGCKASYNVLEKELPYVKLERMDGWFQTMRTISPEEILFRGSGWGALEELREPGITPPGLFFPQESIGNAERPWKLLLAGDVSGLSEWELPLSFMTDERWLAVYEQTTEKAENCTPEFLFHYGVSLYENGHYKEGAAALQRSAAQKPCALTQRTIAHIAFTEGRDAEACDLMRKASAYPDFYLHKAFAEDYVQMLLRAERYEEAWRFYQDLPEWLQMGERMRMHISVAAFEQGEWDFLERQFHTEFSLTREGESRLVELWFKRQAMLLAAERGVENTPALLKEVMETQSPPYEIDFRTFT